VTETNNAVPAVAQVCDLSKGCVDSASSSSPNGLTCVSSDGQSWIAGRHDGRLEWGTFLGGGASSGVSASRHIEKVACLFAKHRAGAGKGGGLVAVTGGDDAEVLVWDGGSG
jgi:hypothetical protein